MKTLYFSIIAVILLGSTAPALASVELDAYLPISGDPVTPQFKFAKSYQLDYHNGGKLKDVLAGRNLTITCPGNSDTNQSVKGLMQMINTELLTSKSSVTVTNLDLTYQFILSGGQSSASMDYDIIIKPTITGYILNSGGTITPTTLDASWVSFAIKEPVVIDTKQCGQTEINYPLNIIKNIFPNVYKIIYNTSGEDVFDQAFNQNLINSTPLLQQSLDKWDSLFDPSYTLTDSAEPSQYKGDKVQVTTFSTGLSGLGQQLTNKIDTDFTADTKYHLLAVDLSSGTINVQGHATALLLQGEPSFSTTANPAKTGAEAPVGGLSTVTIYEIAILAAGIASFLWWAITRRAL